ncbi:MAG: L-threonylcarbamoyladenylate synthase [Bryobacteraceae bacterium]
MCRSSPDLIQRAAAIIREGGLVAFPTETVYGLGANALDPRAVDRIYRAKGRPAASPLIVHAASVEMAHDLASRWPEAADRLATAFWPGPLTLVVPKAAHVPGIVTAGLPTVALRVPNHPTALALLAAAGVPIAAPSANRFSQLSPTTAEHVVASLGPALDLILDDGPSPGGIESTVVSVAGPRPVLLRPGIVTRQQIEGLIGPLDDPEPAPAAHPSPGMHPRHYSPRTPMWLSLPAHGRGAYLWLTQDGPAEISIQMPADAAAYGAMLYRTLHELDAKGLDWIAVEEPPAWPEWEAIRDRLMRASY